MTIELYTLLMAAEWQSLNSPSFVFAIAYNAPAYNSISLTDPVVSGT